VGKNLGGRMITETNQYEPVLKVVDLQAAYQDVIRVLHKVSFHVNEGECVALLGANGAGKTTTLKAISGMLNGEGRVTGGHIWLYEEDITGSPPHRLVPKGVMHVLEGRYVFPDLSVFENLQMGAYSRKDRQNINEEIELVFDYFPQLKDRFNTQAGYLSGGEQQMLVIGRALLARPKVLLLDEPSMGLAPRLVREVFEIIQRIQTEQNLTLLLVEQNANMALRLANRAYLIENGAIAMSGFSEELSDDPRLQEVYLGGMV
jgi:branched-chain amino acid transport system ATP-binding protein